MNINKLMDEAVPRNLDRLLAELGLEKRHSAADYIMPALGVFAAGVVVGGALGLLLAPSSGRELRGDLRTQLDKRVRVAADSDVAPANHNASAPHA